MSNESILAPVAAITLPDSGALTGSAQRALAFIQGFAIESNDDFQLAAGELQSIKRKAKALEEQRTGIVGPLNTAVKAINDLFRSPANILDQAELALKRKMLGWTEAQEKIAAEQRRKAEAEAAAERQRLADVAAAARAQADAAAAEAAAAMAAGDLQAEAQATAKAARAQAEATVAATTSQMVIAPVADIVAPPKAKGISTSETVSFEVTNLLQLCEHITKHPELINLICADTTKLRAYVRSLGTACALPGVKVTTTRSMAARAA